MEFMGPKSTLMKLVFAAPFHLCLSPVAAGRGAASKLLSQPVVPPAAGGPGMEGVGNATGISHAVEFSADLDA